MPIYEYECHDCRKRVSILVLRTSAAASTICPVCGGSALSRLMSRFATVKSEDARLDSLAESSSFGDLDENNPASVARFMKKMGREFGDDLGDDFESAMDEAMAEGEAAGGGGGGYTAAPPRPPGSCACPSPGGGRRVGRGSSRTAAGSRSIACTTDRTGWWRSCRS